jgi:hypothetical protein
MLAAQTSELNTWDERVPFKRDVVTELKPTSFVSTLISIHKAGFALHYK